MDVLKSDFHEIFKEECAMYDEIMQRYADLGSEDGLGAYQLKKDALLCAGRFSDLAVCGKKIKTFSVGCDVTATELKSWAHDRYSQMGKVHDSSRMVWKYCNDNLKNTI